MGCPTGKIIFKDRQAAVERLDSLLRNTDRQRAKGLEIYHCRTCGWLHLGHRLKETPPRRGKNKGRRPTSYQI